MSFLRRLLGRDHADDTIGENGLPLAPRVPPRVETTRTATAPPAPTTPTAGGGSVFLAEVGPKKIAVIKVVREASGLGLREAKDLVESAPTLIVSGLSPEAAAALRRDLESAGARVG
ncbi:ribosomal protein bL12 [Solirubrobacter phytolaccae]|uniref:ribosomal protein bL12 n=1 Tax=Solirubrobacter phytolaccae TaxID=1404360 RepID=UPI003555C3BC